MLGGEFLRHPQLQRFCCARGKESSRSPALYKFSPHRNVSAFQKTVKSSKRIKKNKSQRSLGQKRHCTVPGTTEVVSTGFDWRTRAPTNSNRDSSPTAGAPPGLAADWEGNSKVTISTTSQVLPPGDICWLLFSSSAWQRARNPWQRSGFHTSDVLQQPRGRNHSRCQLRATRKGWIKEKATSSPLKYTAEQGWATGLPNTSTPVPVTQELHRGKSTGHPRGYCCNCVYVG